MRRNAHMGKALGSVRLRNVVCCPNDAAVDFAACVNKEAERRLMAYERNITCALLRRDTSRRTACSREHKCRAARVRGEV